MPKLRKKSTKGYILLDILIGLFIIGFGFSAIIGLINGAVMARGETEHFLQAVNLANSTMEELLKNLEEDSSYRYVLLAGETTGRVGNLERSIRGEWDSVDLLLITVEVEWLEKDKEKDFFLESLVYVPEENRT